MIYLDNAATTNKKPYQVIEAITEELYESANPGRASHKLSLKSFNKIYETRESLARLFKVNMPENFILTPNATYALNFAIKSGKFLRSHGFCQTKHRDCFYCQCEDHTAYRLMN